MLSLGLLTHNVFLLADDPMDIRQSVRLGATDRWGGSVFLRRVTAVCDLVLTNYINATLLRTPRKLPQAADSA